jgi:hypothetical protein
VLALAVVSALAGGAAGQPGQVPPFDPTVPASDLAVHNGELLSHPREDGVTLTLLAAEPAVLYVEYAPEGGPPAVTPVVRVGADELAVFDLGGLEAGAEVAYRVRARRPAEARFAARAVHGFRTARPPGETVSFAISACSHAWALWSRATCGAVPSFDKDLEKLLLTLDNIGQDEQVDFVVLMGDDVMTQCGLGCYPCDVDGLPAGGATVSSPQQAMLRYRQSFSPGLLGRLLADKPYVFNLGNHDGETPFGDPTGTCGIYDTTLEWSRAARLHHLANPYPVYGGWPEGNWFAFTSGDALLVVLDVYRNVRRLPTGPGDWTLGEQQLRWLEETLRSSDRTWKFVFAEHLLGGVTGPQNCYHYGRGSIRSTVDGQPESPFLGEQALVHDLLTRYGAQAFFMAHDHVAALGVKPAADGSDREVLYVTAGQPGGHWPNWAEETWYRETMDFDGDGVPEYDTDLTGTRKRGYFKVTVQGRERALLQYVRTSVDSPAANGSVLLEWTLEP